MRSLLALILSWLMPSTGKRRAAPTHEQASMVSTADTPTRRLAISLAGVGRPFLPNRLPREPELLRGEDVALIRPYLIEHERTRGIYRQGALA